MGFEKMGYVKVDETIKEYYKIYDLSKALNIPQYAAGGLVIFLWTWAEKNADNFDLSKHPISAIARACFWDKKPEELIEALVSSDLLDKNMKMVFFGKTTK